MPIATLYRIIQEQHLIAKTIVLDRNELLHYQSKADTNIYYVQSGSVRVFFNKNEEQQTIRFGYENNIITLLDSFFTAHESQYNIQAIKQSTLQVIPKAPLMNYLFQSKEGMELWINILEGLVLQQMERELDLLISSPEARYNTIAQRSPKLLQAIPHKHIANYLRMSPETLSRLKKS
jgi:CRP-like cAMP-binding protein